MPVVRMTREMPHPHDELAHLFTQWAEQYGVRITRVMCDWVDLSGIQGPVFKIDCMDIISRSSGQ